MAKNVLIVLHGRQEMMHFVLPNTTSSILQVSTSFFIFMIKQQIFVKIQDGFLRYTLANPSFIALYNKNWLGRGQGPLPIKQNTSGVIILLFVLQDKRPTYRFRKNKPPKSARVCSPKKSINTTEAPSVFRYSAQSQCG